MIETPSIQWFPGHMAKTRRLIQESLKLVDLVLEITDARIPQSSRNPELDKWVQNKPRMILLNKADSADAAVTAQWLEYYRERGITALACDCRSGKGLNRFLPAVKELLADVMKRRRKKGLVGGAVRIMIVGIPNVGKSSFINRMAGSKRAKVEDRPGVTRGRQWVSIGTDMELLDMPGVLWPKFEDPAVGEKLAFTGAVKDDVIDIELLAMRLLGYLRREYPHTIEERYKLAGTGYQELDEFGLLELVGRKRGMLVSGGEVNTERAAITVMDEYRSGKLGKITFDRPPKSEVSE
ncbi:Ribosome biogenesis GTPase A [uncultured Ruminococcus sp.]|uniref:Ribosome biogenesis GTPase A n=1 Tax=Massiliimalia timonensis TaxID=1987501 RepID=A0A8J6TRW8_9FIRM|nr:ribosome biogenesis GTPase YlqF [Massiliimalia timonensis]MBC8611546.1 ribosome biogenesis GTPase YlqF [Massiliimalia timonensis]SCH01204.1 Ribosome biogenesis GTPase A [uncultured Clostridium sp.]SCH97110.1 Ribosome biogenesis GTPase A [uncultured Ruminococcus sp.]